MKRVAVLGPTASGKSAVALAAAQRRGGVELISIDAMQVYRGMDIGTAKPTAEEQALVRHHGIDLVEPSHEFTVAEFQAHVRVAVDRIAAVGRDALFVGGTGLYLRAILDDLELPGQWPEIRADLEAAATLDLGALHRELTDLDPVAAAKIEPTNARRVVRALEVCRGSGRRFSSFGPGLDTYPQIPSVQIGLSWDRAVLARRIEERVHRMLELGLLAETERLLAAGPISRTARQALGYRELIGHLEGEWSLAEATEAIVLRTRQFAVRQDRWFRRDPRIRWIHVEDDPVAEGLPVLLDCLDA